MERKVGIRADTERAQLVRTTPLIIQRGQAPFHRQNQRASQLIQLVALGREFDGPPVSVEQGCPDVLLQPL